MVYCQSLLANNGHLEKGNMKYPEDYINKIICGDCLEVMKGIPDKSVDLVCTDMPYGIDIDYGVYVDSIDNLKKLIAESIPEFLRIGKRVAIFTGITNLFLYPQPNWIMSFTWNTTGSFGKCGINQWQPIIFYGEDIKGFGSVNGILKSDTLAFSGMGAAKYSQNDHPCPKPERVMMKAIARLSNENEIVLDAFTGSGTTLKACQELNRRFIGIEINPKYCEIAQRRLAQEYLFT